MATVTTTAIQQEPPLRKRARVLERTQSSTLNLRSTESKAPPLTDTKLAHDDVVDSHFPEYESPSEMSDDELSPGGVEEHRASSEGRVKPKRPTIDTGNHGHHHHSPTKSSPASPTSRAWYEFDLAVVVALVSPIGNWLTGTDHVKNLLLIVLLIFYLHQIIEIPWSLYQKSRPRERGYRLSPALADPTSAESRYANLAASELKKFEFFFLFLTFVSPIVGAALLRYATDAILGPAAVSWFSTGLFVLATGMRPWAHLVERLSHRTAELHDFVHYPSAAHTITSEEHIFLEKRVAQLEKALTKIKSKVAHTTEDVYEYVDDAVDAVEHAIRKQERKWDKYEDKVKEVEQVVVKLSSKRGQGGVRALLAGDIQYLKMVLSSMTKLLLPSWVIWAISENVNGHRQVYNSASANSSATSLLGVNPSIRIRALSPSPSPTPLETIAEEDPIYLQTKSSYLAMPYRVTSALVYKVGYMATTPLRAVVRMVLRNY
ncbi:hypothetical protein M413DRAFT_445243 [Hebeloma cylindrosporum]|uniref:Uncharacterized protein n=1 Tax=Hebeloma cylindrosporum TaxID=76867 RepID=A0A0C2XWQ9_HEBCY|nr:hypothetical protein M413DRAFT_445243 [Hebeloma cylindrosporum h7]